MKIVTVIQDTTGGIIIKDKRYSSDYAQKWYDLTRLVIADADIIFITDGVAVAPGGTTIVGEAPPVDVLAWNTFSPGSYWKARAFARVGEPLLLVDVTCPVTAAIPAMSTQDVRLVFTGVPDPDRVSLVMYQGVDVSAEWQAKFTELVAIYDPYTEEDLGEHAFNAISKGHGWSLLPKEYMYWAGDSFSGTVRVRSYRNMEVMLL